MTPVVAPDQRSPRGIVDSDVIHDIVCEVEVIGVMDTVGLQETILIVGLVDIAQIDIPGHARPPFIEIMRNSQPSLLVAISP